MCAIVYWKLVGIFRGWNTGGGGGASAARAVLCWDGEGRGVEALCHGPYMVLTLDVFQLPSSFTPTPPSCSCVAVTGSIIPFASPWNDARRNLIVSLMFATCSDLCEVCISFGGRLLRGNRSRKMSSVDVEAFDSPNFPPLGETSAAR